MYELSTQKVQTVSARDLKKKHMSKISLYDTTRYKIRVRLELVDSKKKHQAKTKTQVPFLNHTTCPP